MKRLIVCSGLLMSCVLAYEGHAAGPDDVDYRQNVMKTLGAQTRALQLVLQKRAPAGHLLNHVRALAATSGQVAGAFQPHAEGGNARATIWSEWDDFAEIAELQAERLADLEEALAGGRASAEQVGDVLACKQCHDAYRSEVDEEDAGEIDDVIGYRRYLMQAMDAQTAAIGQVLAWMVADDQFVSHLVVVARNAEITLESFEPAVQGGEALPLIWEQWENYAADMRAFSDAVANAAEVARSEGKDAAIVPVMDALSCKQCHDVYRSE